MSGQDLDIVDVVVRRKKSQDSGNDRGRRRHSSGETMHAKRDSSLENVRRSLQDLRLLREDRMLVYKVKSLGHVANNKLTVPGNKIPLYSKQDCDQPCKDNTDSGTLRVATSLCNGELSSCIKRKEQMSKTFHQFIGRDKKCSIEEIPNIAVIGSGGGVRAMVAMSSAFKTLHDLEILKYVLYVAGLSGSSWYLTTLYSHAKWPNVHPDEIHKDIKEKVKDGILNKVLAILQVPGAVLSNLVLQLRPVNLVELFGLFLSSNLMPDRCKSTWSEHRKKVEGGKAPFPLLSCIHARSEVSAKQYHEWVEISPYEVAMPKYGIGMDTPYFGSKFERGKIVEEIKELPIYYIQGICGSAFTIINKEYNVMKKDSAAIDDDLKKEKEVHTVSLSVPSKCNSEDMVDGIQIDDVETTSSVSSSGDVEAKDVQDASQSEGVIDSFQEESVQGLTSVFPQYKTVEFIEYNDRREEVKNVFSAKKRRSLNTLESKPLDSAVDNLNSQNDHSNDVPDKRSVNGSQFTWNVNSKDKDAATETEEQRIRRIREECPEWIKDFINTDNNTQNGGNGGEDEVDGIIEDAFGYVHKLVKGYIMERRDAFRAAWLNNPIRRLSFEGISPSYFTAKEGTFSQIFEKADDEPTFCFIDAGLAFNSPYPLVLRAQRSIDLILSFDFTDRNSINGDPFKEVELAKKWAELHSMKFPPIPKFNPEEEVKELYIFEDPNDPYCPVIMHFVLINKEFKQFSQPGKRRTPEEEKFADFDMFVGENCPYNSQNFQYDELQFDRLSKLVEFIVRNNYEEMKRQIRKCYERRFVKNKRLDK